MPSTRATDRVNLNNKHRVCITRANPEISKLGKAEPASTARRRTSVVNWGGSGVCGGDRNSSPV